MEFIKTELTRNVLVVGSKGVGKTTFITKLLYNYTPRKYLPTKRDRRYTLTYSFPPPTIRLQIIESREAMLDIDFAFVIFIYNPRKPKTREHICKMYLDMKRHYPDVFRAYVLSSDRLT